MHGISSAMTASTLNAHLAADGAHAAGATQAGWQNPYKKRQYYCNRLLTSASQLLGHMHMYICIYAALQFTNNCNR